MALNKAWTTKEDQFLRENYQDKSHRVMADLLNRTRDSIKHRCIYLKLGSKAKMLEQNQEDLDRIVDYLTKMGPTSRSSLCQHLKIPHSMIPNKLDKLRLAGIIKPIQFGKIRGWTLCQQTKRNEVIKPTKIPVKNTSPFEHLPSSIQQWFGFTTFKPPQGRHIEETIYNQPLRTHTHTRGNGSFGYLNMLGD